MNPPLEALARGSMRETERLVCRWHETALDSKLVTELKEELGRLGQKKGGSKAELVQRLVAYISESRRGPVLYSLTDKLQLNPLAGVMLLDGEKEGTFDDMYKMAKNVYNCMKALKISFLPDFDSKDQNGTLELLIKQREGTIGQHIERGLFTIVSGDADALSKLSFGTQAVDVRPFCGGAVVCIFGKTASLLGGNAWAAPLHKADLADGEYLRILTLRVKADLPLPYPQTGRLQGALQEFFGEEEAHAPQVEPGVYRPVPPPVNLFSSSSKKVTVQVNNFYETGSAMYFRIMSDATLRRLYKAVYQQLCLNSERWSERDISDLTLTYDGVPLRSDITLEHVDFEDGDSLEIEEPLPDVEDPIDMNM